MFDIDPFLQYGVLGIIGFIFLRMSNNLFDKQGKHFEILINNLVKEKTDSFDELKELSAALLQTLNNQNKYITQLFSDLTQKLNTEVTNKQDIVKIFLEQEERSFKRDIEFVGMLAEYRRVLYEMRTNCNCILNNKKRIGNIIVEKGLISQVQLDAIVKEQEDDFLQSMGVKK